jgi:hypothetical protein
MSAWCQKRKSPRLAVAAHFSVTVVHKERKPQATHLGLEFVASRGFYTERPGVSEDGGRPVWPRRRVKLQRRMPVSTNDGKRLHANKHTGARNRLRPLLRHHSMHADAPDD